METTLAEAPGNNGHSTTKALRTKKRTLKASAPGRKRMKRKEQARRNFTSAVCSLFGSSQMMTHTQIARKPKGSKHANPPMTDMDRCSPFPLQYTPW